MQVKTQGLIIREQTVGESDRLVTVLTRDAGVVRAFARRAKNLKDSKSAATQLLCYSRLSIFKGREKYMIDDAEPIEVFFGLRRDIAALSLAQYFCELAYLMVPEDTDSEEYLRLILNSLHFLSKGTRPIRLLQFHGANEPYVALPPGVLTAMRHIAYVDFEKLYNFSLPEDALKILNAATESYVVHTLHTVPKTLEFYKTFLD